MSQRFFASQVCNKCRRWDNVLGIVMRLQSVSSGVRIPAGGSYFLSYKTSRPDLPSPSLVLNGCWIPFPSEKRPGRELFPCIPRSAWVKNGRAVTLLLLASWRRKESFCILPFCGCRVVPDVSAGLPGRRRSLC